MHVYNKGADQSVCLPSLITAFVFDSLESIPAKFLLHANILATL